VKREGRSLAKFIVTPKISERWVPGTVRSESVYIFLIKGNILISRNIKYTSVPTRPTKQVRTSTTCRWPNLTKGLIWH
jgi:hypothetical protein